MADALKDTGTLRRAFRDVYVDELPCEENDKMRIKEWLLAGAQLKATRIHKREEYWLTLGDLDCHLSNDGWSVRTTRKVGFSVVESFFDDYFEQQRESDRST